MSGLAVCTRDQNLAEFLRTIGQRAALNTTVIDQPAQATRSLGELHPAVILLDEQFSPHATNELASNLLTLLPEAKIILLLRGHGFEALRQAMRSGITDALLVPDELDRLPDLLSRLLNDQTAGQTTGRVLAFFRARGGAGATFLAVNAAAVATQLVQGKVLLIDGNLLSSDVAGMLNLKPQRTILDLAPVLDELTPRHIEDVCTVHSSGLHVLMAPTEPAMGTALAPEHLALIVRVAQRAYRAVVVDCPPLSDERCTAILRVGTRPLLVTEADAPSIFAWRRLYPLVGDLGGRAAVVVNKTTARTEFSTEEMANWLQLPLAGEVRHAEAIVTPLVNTGKTLLEARSGRRFTIRPPGIIRDVVRLTDRLLK